MLSVLLFSIVFALNRAQFVSSIGKKMVRYSFAAYCDRNVPSTLRDGVSITNNHLLALLGYDPSLNALVVSFRGSDTASNWFANINFIRRDYKRNGAPNPRCWWICSRQPSIHRGWDIAWLNFKRYIEPELKALKAKYPNRYLFVTGHSLGGALADIASLDFTQFYDRNKIIVYSVGAPMWSNGALASWFNTRITKHFRLANNGDPVVVLPPTWTGYKPPTLRVNGQGSSHGKYLGIRRGCSAGGAVAGHFADQSTLMILNPLMNISISIGINVKMIIYGPADRWFAIGFGTQMIGTPAYLYSTGNVTGPDQIPSLWPHILKAKQLVGVTPFTNASGMAVMHSTTRNNIIILEVQRPLNGTSPRDYSFHKGQKEIPIVWAHSGSSSHQLTGSGHGVNRGSAKMIMGLQTQVAPSNAKGSEKKKRVRAEMIGAIIGGILVVCVCASILFYIFKNKKSTKYVEMDNQGYVPPSRV